MWYVSRHNNFPTSSYCNFHPFNFSLLQCVFLMIFATERGTDMVHNTEEYLLRYPGKLSKRNENEMMILICQKDVRYHFRLLRRAQVRQTGYQIHIFLTLCRLEFQYETKEKREKSLSLKQNISEKGKSRNFFFIYLDRWIKKLSCAPLRSHADSNVAAAVQDEFSTSEWYFHYKSTSNANGSNHSLRYAAVSGSKKCENFHIPYSFFLAFFFEVVWICDMLDTGKL